MQPEPCNEDVFKKGYGICTLNACSIRAEEWVQAVAKESGQKVDWHYSGGIANVLYTGQYDKVLAAVKKLEPELTKTPKFKEGERCRCQQSFDKMKPTKHEPCAIMNIFESGAHGLYRAGDELSEDVVAVDSH
jgi:hypothetical protein